MLASIKALLDSIVDYAGLFPPAKLDMEEAMNNYVRYRNAPQSWMLGRFVLPAARSTQWEELLTPNKTTRWSLSTILSRDWEGEIKELLKREWQEEIEIAAIEFPVIPPPEIEKIIPYLPLKADLFWEIPLNDELETYLRAIERVKGGAKIRTGGTSADAFPSAIDICRFIFAAREAGVPFKATAGLHHPLSAANGPACGFLNLAFLAASIYWQQITEPEAIELLKESSLEAFRFEADSIFWRGYRLETRQLQQARQNFFRSFGSCSFEEPIGDSIALGFSLSQPDNRGNDKESTKRK